MANRVSSQQAIQIHIIFHLNVWFCRCLFSWLLSDIWRRDGIVSIAVVPQLAHEDGCQTWRVHFCTFRATSEKNARSPVVQFSPSYRAVRSFPLLIMEVPLAQNLALTRTNGEPSCQKWFLDSKAPPLVPVIALLIPPPAVDGYLATFNKWILRYPEWTSDRFLSAHLKWYAVVMILTSALTILRYPQPKK